MKSPSTARLSLIVFTVAFFAFYFVSCKKTDRPSMKSEAVKAEIPDWVKQKAKDAPKSVTIEMNLKTKGIFLDQNGNEKTFPKGANGRTLSMPCDATDPDFEDNTFNLQSIDVNFQGCNNSFTVTAHYQLSTGFNVVSANPLNSTQLTRGRMRIRQGTSNILYTDNNIAIASSDIVLLGSDPSNPNKKLYSITYTSQPITNTSWLQNTIYFEERPIIYTDCSDAIITPATWQAIPWSFGLNVCNRIDPIQIMPNGSGSIIYFNGVDAAVQYGGASCYPSGVERPTETEVQWNQGGSWATIPFNNAWGCSPSQASNLPSVLTMPYTFTAILGQDSSILVCLCIYIFYHSLATL